MLSCYKGLNAKVHAAHEDDVQLQLALKVHGSSAHEDRIFVAIPIYRKYGEVSFLTTLAFSYHEGVVIAEEIDQLAPVANINAQAVVGVILGGFGFQLLVHVAETEDTSIGVTVSTHLNAYTIATEPYAESEPVVIDIEVSGVAVMTFHATWKFVSYESFTYKLNSEVYQVTLSQVLKYLEFQCATTTTSHSESHIQLTSTV